jgi:hydroxyacylglutathione hydrolase
MYVSPLPAFENNYIWLLEFGPQAIVVDPGLAPPVWAALKAHNLTLRAILLTHRHQDHTGGVAELAQGGVAVYGPLGLPGVSHPVFDGERVKVRGWARGIDVWTTPGHTSEHVSYLVGGHVFCGDTLFAAGCGRVFDDDPEALYHSLQRFKALDPDTLFYPAHEYTQTNLRFALSVEPDNPEISRRLRRVEERRQQGLPSLPTTLADELATNPFLRDNPALRHSAATVLGHEPADALASFVALRQLRNDFRA